jgi:hypothetical protein
MTTKSTGSFAEIAWRRPPGLRWRWLHQFTSASGQETVSKNALVHGLAGRRRRLPGEEGPLEQFCREMIQLSLP